MKASKNKKFYISIILSVLILIFISAFIFLLMSLTNIKVKKNITIEAGTAVPNPEEFFIKPVISGRFITDISAVDTAKIGTVEIDLEVKGKQYASFLTITDTVAPTGKPAEQYVFRGNEINPDDLVTDIDDATQVVCSFASPIDSDKPGWNDAAVLLTDEGGNSASVNSRFYVFDAEENLSVEAGSVFDIPPPEDFIKNYTDDKNDENLSNLSVSLDNMSGVSGDINFSALGSYPVTLKSGKYETKSVLTITDTTAPTGKPVEQYIFKNNEIAPENFVTDINDVTRVTCSFAPPPDLNKTGRQDVTVLLTDEGGNSADIDSELYIFDSVNEITVEAGTVTGLAAKDFIKNCGETDNENLNIDIKIIGINYSQPGIYPVELQYGQYKTASAVKIADTVAPTGKPVEQYIFRGDKITPDDLVTDITDATEVTRSFIMPPDSSKAGWHEQTVTLTDESGNSANIDSKFYVFDVMNELTVEADTVRNITAENLIRNYIGVKDLSAVQNGNLNLTVPGTYSVTLKSGKYTVQTVVKVADTTQPTGSVKNCRTYKDKPISASQFAYDIKDISSVTVKYKNLPDFSVPGVQTVGIVLEDAYKNSSEYNAELTVIYDTTPPEISGDVDKTVTIGDSVAYKSGITVSDDYDSNAAATLKADGSGVNLNSPGTYTVIYYAADESGNKAEVKGTITVRAIDMDYVKEMADGIIAQITDSGMTQYDKAKAVFDWVNRKMKYSTNKITRDAAQGAYYCFTKGIGDCFTYMAASEVLLTEAGIRNVTVQRSGSTQQHYWNLVNAGDGWYHFDVCPVPGDAVSANRRFMFTDSQAEQYSSEINTPYVYYQYDKSSVPEVVQ